MADKKATGFVWQTFAGMPHELIEHSICDQ
jgi:hypothetical protein